MSPRPTLRSLSSLPRPPGGSGPRVADGALLVVLAALSLVEGLVREDLPLGSAALLVTFATMPTLLWRRVQPLAMLSLAFGAAAALDLLRLGGSELPKVHSMVALLLLSYALPRWGSGREVLAGLGVVAVCASLGFAADHLNVGEILGGSGILLASMALGAVLRSRDRLHRRELERVRLKEREQLARDLHDTVAHHVSAIAIRAQAGLAVGGTRPEAAVDALRLIEGEASRTLAEMRMMVGVLREGEQAALTPHANLRELERLATPGEGGPRVEVQIRGDVEGVSESVASTVFRLAQESVTNARRHARRASRIEVGVQADEGSVHLCVRDDGASEPRAAQPGFGILGMRERAQLLGGTCEAGPDPGRGWVVTAALPRHGPSR